MTFQTAVAFVLWSTTTYEALADISTWITPPIHNLNDPSVQSMVSRCAQTLSTSGIFHIENFLSAEGLALFQEKMRLIEDKRNRKLRTKNVFQDSGDLVHFDREHARNHETPYSIGFIGKSALATAFIDIYTYEPLLAFLKDILLSTHHASNTSLDCKTYSDLHLSAAQEGSVYAYIAQHGDHGAWHFDQHPFSCVWLISKPYGGGQLQYKFTPPQFNANYTTYQEKKLGYDWDLLHEIIVHDDESYSHRLSANEGDIYCFKGNITVHMVQQVAGDRLRSVFVTAFADYPNFTHIQEINNANAWSVKIEL